MRNLLQDIARSATPEQLHEACLLWSMQSPWGPVVPEHAPWLFFHLPKGVDFHHFTLGFDIPGRLEWPRCEVREFNVCRSDGSADGCLYLIWMEDGSKFDPYFLWSTAVFSGRSVIHGTAGWGAPAMVVPPNWDPSHSITLTPDAVREELSVVVTTSWFDLMDLSEIQSAGPVVIPGFPKFDAEGEGVDLVENFYRDSLEVI